MKPIYKPSNRVLGKLYKALFFSCCLIFSLSHRAECQNRINFVKLGVESGLSTSSINCSFQDRKGFMWIGTTEGLNKYDGYTFKIYRPEKNNPFSICGSYIESVCEDLEGNLWIGCRGNGLCRYSPKEDKFYSIPELSKSTVKQIIKDKNGDLWIIGEPLFYKYDHKLKTFTSLTKNGIFPNYIFSNIAEGKNQEFWLSTRENGFIKYNSKTKTYKQYINNPKDTNSLSDNKLRCLTIDSYGKIWAGTESKGLEKFDPETENFFHYPYYPKRKDGVRASKILCLLAQNNILWVGTENGGMHKLNMDNNVFEYIFYNKNDPDSYNDNSVWSLYKDPQGRIWVGSFSKGVSIIDNYRQKFHNMELPLENKTVNFIFKDRKNNLWFGTEGGLVRKKDGEMKVYKHDPFNPKSLGSDPVLSICEDKKGRIWVGTWEGGLNLFDEKNDNFIIFKPDSTNPNSLSSSSIISLIVEKETDHLLIGTEKGLNVMSFSNIGFFEKFLSDPNNPKTLSHNNVFSIIKDRKKNLWVCTARGLNLFDFQKKEFKRYLYNANDNLSYVNDQINVFFEDSKGRVWIGTGNGMKQMIDESHFESYTTDNGLPSNTVLGILGDQNENLWITTNKGLSRFNIKTKKIRNYDVSDGLKSNQFRKNAFMVNSDSNFIIGGVEGANNFNPYDVKDNPYKPNVYLTDLKIFNKSVAILAKDSILKQNINETQEITLSHEDYVVTLDFAALNYTMSAKNQYAYKLDPLEKDWNYSGNKHTVTFTNLDAGTYTFKIKASNNDGVWNEKETRLIIHVLPPWWETWWFRCLVAFIIISILVIYYRIKVSLISDRNKKLEKMVSIRTKDLQNANMEINEINKELVAREEEIITQNEELHEQREELTAQYEELGKGKSEIAMQKDLLARQNQELLDAQSIIEKQNEEILSRNKLLSEEVIKKTKELVEYNQQLEQFAYVTAHNLRAPVARILGLGSILNIEGTNIEEEKNIINKLIFTTIELDQVIKDLNTILEIKNNTTEYLINVDLEEELNKVKSNLKKEISDSSAEITTNLSEITVISSIRAYIYSIFLNLISNAIKYRHPGRIPVIEIETHINNDFIRISVKDNGLGINLNLHKKNLFNLYKRFHSHVEGKGLGLYLVKTQVEALGGRIEVFSEENVGTSFTIYLKNHIKEV